MKELENKLGYIFKDKNILNTALTHSSFANEKRKQGAECNERLEFLGDSILGATVAEYLYNNYPQLPEGKMTKIRAELVCENSLYDVACKWDLGRYLNLGRGEEQNGGRERVSILADAVEAVFAAVYIDGGRQQAERIINSFIISKLSSGVTNENHDYKTALQELVQRTGSAVIAYELVDERGPDHSKEFTMQVLVNGISAGSGNGKSKKEAEQAAARSALEGMDNNE